MINTVSLFEYVTPAVAFAIVYWYVIKHVLQSYSMSVGIVFSTFNIIIAVWIGAYNWYNRLSPYVLDGESIYPLNLFTAGIYLACRLIVGRERDTHKLNS